MHVLHVVGARPNFMKAAPVLRALAEKSGVRQMLVHTGQHYDAAMSDVFFQQLGLPEPDVNLGVGSGTHTEQTAAVMVGFEKVLLESKPDWVVVYGDVNSTVAAALVAAKVGIRVAHVEAGLRSFDRAMPEEINRLLTDQISDLLLTPSQDGNDNLAREGIAANKVHLVGNVMIDSLRRVLPSIASSASKALPAKYALVTLHRPSNVDDLPWLASMLDALSELSSSISVVFPVHPRTRQRIASFKNFTASNGLQLLDPVPYLEFLALQSKATVVVTDSGGIQEETTCLGVPCLTIRENTERPITVTVGTNILVGRDIVRVKQEISKILGGEVKIGQIPPLWDGHTAQRIADVITSTA
jgi:UDP-N-acetylglucosamine 2-epimerase (non-hydrolysing)